jgi:hypothetical protein
MSTEKLNEILKEAEALSADEKVYLAQCLLEQAQKIEKSSLVSRHDDSLNAETEAYRRAQHMKWLKEHQAEYGGRYVALDGERLLGQAATYREAAEEARKTGVQNPFIVHVPDPNTVYFGGW